MGRGRKPFAKRSNSEGAQQLKGIMHGDTEGQRKPHIAQNARQRAVQRL